MNLRTTTQIAIASLFLLAAGCGGDDGGGSSGNNLALCANFSACGGDPAGTWTLDSSCFDGEITIPGCSDATFDIDISQSGTAVLNEDGSFSASVVTEGASTVSAPASCLPTQITDCDQLSDVEDGTACVGDAEVECTCSQSLDETSNDTGTWITAGNTITISVDGDEPDVFEYCVNGDTLTLYQDDGDVTTALRFRR